jgi:hypothetical protein
MGNHDMREAMCNGVCARRAQVFGLGFVSVFDQVLEGLPPGDKGPLFDAYLSALDETPQQFREARTRLCAHSPCFPLPIAEHIRSANMAGPDSKDMPCGRS